VRAAPRFYRTEKSFRSGGHFVIAGLPAGSLVINTRAEGAYATTKLELAAGEHKTGIAIELTRFVTLVGRVVDHATGTPVRDVCLMMRRIERTHFEGLGVTDDAGRFTIVNAPIGTLALGNAELRKTYGTIGLLRDIAGTGTIDLGDLPIYKFRTPPGEPAGTRGFDFDVTPGGLRIRSLDRAADLTVGDLITAIDGVDVTGHAAMHAATLLGAPPGTVIHLGLLRGVTAAITLA
jgi:hypothetical protein